MAALTESERQAWHRAEQQRIEARRRYCTSPVTPATPIVPRDPGHSYSLRGEGALPRR